MGAKLKYLLLATNSAYKISDRTLLTSVKKQYKNLGSEIDQILDMYGIEVPSSHNIYDIKKPAPQWESVLEGRIRYMNREMCDYLKLHKQKTTGIKYYGVAIKDIPDSVDDIDQFAVNMMIPSTKSIIAFSLVTIEMTGESTYPHFHNFMMTGNHPKDCYCPTRYVKAHVGNVISINVDDQRLSYLVTAMSPTNASFRQLHDFNYDTWSWSKADKVVRAKTILDSTKHHIWNIFNDENVVYSDSKVQRP